MPTKVAFVRYGEPDATQPVQASEDDKLLIEKLRIKEVKVDVVSWRNAGVKWAEYDAVVVRASSGVPTFGKTSEEIEGFREWLASLEMPVLNDPDLMLGNLNKTYQENLGKKGVSVIETEYLDSVEGDLKATKEAIMESIIRNQGEDKNAKVTIKRSIGACGVQVIFFDPAKSDEFQGQLDKLLESPFLKGEKIMVQPFQQNINLGETSFVFIDGELSHAARRTPREGNFLVQGGNTEVFLASEMERGDIGKSAKFAQKVYAKFKKEFCPNDKPLYMRVDVFIGNDGKPCCMEVDVVEPNLFLKALEERGKERGEAAEEARLVLNSALETFADKVASTAKVGMRMREAAATALRAGGLNKKVA